MPKNMNKPPVLDVVHLKLVELIWHAENIVSDNFHYGADGRFEVDFKNNFILSHFHFRASCDDSGEEKSFMLLRSEIKFSMVGDYDEVEQPQYLRMTIENYSKELIMGQARQYLISLLGASGYPPQIILPPALSSIPFKIQLEEEAE